eukprot:479519-Pelagomonas_calceolata.AAC.3
MGTTYQPCCLVHVMQMSLAIDEERRQQGDIISTLVSLLLCNAVTRLKRCLTQCLHQVINILCTPAPG